MASRIRILPDVLCRELDGELVLLELRRGIYYGLDAVGMRVWQLLGDERPLDEIVACLMAEYEVDAAEAAADVQALVGTLCDHGLVEAHD